MHDLKEFIERSSAWRKEYFPDKIPFAYDRDKWKRENPEKFKECQIKYFKTKKGKDAAFKTSVKRRERFKEACQDLDWKEKKLIRKFYKRCPKGYEVDHIIPIAKGGKHSISNLQYLTPEQNRRKAYRLDWKPQ